MGRREQRNKQISLRIRTVWAKYSESVSVIQFQATLSDAYVNWQRIPCNGQTYQRVLNCKSIYYLLLFPFRWFKKGSCQFLAKECAQYWLAELSLPSKRVVR